MSAAVSLAYTAEMQEAGVPVTFAYISDAHDNHGTAGNAHIAYGPGSAGYVAQLKAYDDAFGAFFSRLAADGIDKSNTLFVFTVDEGDHFAGVQKTDCDGVTTPCDYGPTEVGEINANIKTLVANQTTGLGTAWTVHGDDAPTFYLSNNPGETDPFVRDFERQVSGLTAVNPYTGATDHLMVAMADRAEMKLLHMYTAGDPLRDPDVRLLRQRRLLPDRLPGEHVPDVHQPGVRLEPRRHPAGDRQHLARVRRARASGRSARPAKSGPITPTSGRPCWSTWGCPTTYQNDGRAILEILDGNVVPHSLNVHRGSIQALGAAYKQLTAPFGDLGMASLRLRRPESSPAPARTIPPTPPRNAKLADWLTRRDALASQIAARSKVPNSTARASASPR